MNDPRDVSWWPDFTGCGVVVMAAGPSMSRLQADIVRSSGLISISINETWKLATWADYHYCCDWQYLKSKAPCKDAITSQRMIGKIPPRGLPPEMKWQEPLLKYVDVRAGHGHLIWDGFQIGGGGNSAFQITNWALRCGAKKVILLGVDCHSPNKHWHGVHDHPEAPVQKEATIEGWKRAWFNASRDPRATGKIVNCSPGTALQSIPRSDLLAEIGEV